MKLIGLLVLEKTWTGNQESAQVEERKDGRTQGHKNVRREGCTLKGDQAKNSVPPLVGGAQ